MLFIDIKRMQQKADLKHYVKLEMTSEIYEVRKAKGITKKQLAKMSGVKKQVITDIENGKSLASFKTLSKLLSALNAVADVTIRVD